MDKAKRLQSAFSQIQSAVRQLILPGIGPVTPEISNDFSRINLRRVSLTSLLAIPVHVVCFVQFWLTKPGNPVEAEWRQAIMTSHAFFFLFMLLMALLANLLPWKKAGIAMQAMHYGMISMIMAGGLLIVTIDQLVGDNITVYLLVCLLCGVLFLTPPLTALIYYALSYLAFFILVGLYQAEASRLLAARVNGLVAAAIGLAIAVVMWRYNYFHVIQGRQIAEQQNLLLVKNQELEKMAFLDPLTALPNRRFFDEIVKKEIAQVRRNAHVSCLLILDIDHFKNINDTYGHATGDEVLCQLAHLLQDSLRQSDVIARLGGEEFIVLLPETQLAAAVQVADKLRVTIERHIFLISGEKISLTASFGVAQLRLPQRSQFNYYSDCDKALYQAKQKGRNRVEIATPA